MRSRGVNLDAGLPVEQADMLGAILNHYAGTTQPLVGLSRMEEEINVALLSRARRRHSTRYRCFIDGRAQLDGRGSSSTLEGRRHRRHDRFARGRQLTTPALYEEACARYAVEPNEAASAALAARTWQQRVPLIFSADELKEAGRELTSVAKTIRDLDAGRLYPIRHGSPQNCRGCRFKGICRDPRNDFLVDALFERRPAKRDLPKAPA